MSTFLFVSQGYISCEVRRMKLGYKKCVLVLKQLCTAGVRGGGGWEQQTTTQPSWQRWKSGEEDGGAGEGTQTAL